MPPRLPNDRELFNHRRELNENRIQYTYNRARDHLIESGVFSNDDTTTTEWVPHPTAVYEQLSELPGYYPQTLVYYRLSISSGYVGEHEASITHPPIYVEMGLITKSDDKRNIESIFRVATLEPEKITLTHLSPNNGQVVNNQVEHPFDTPFVDLSDTITLIIEGPEAAGLRPEPVED